MDPGGTVFVVDDDAAIRESLQVLLEAKGYRVATFASAEAFLHSYRSGDPGCAIVDLRMPGMDGLALMERMTTLGAKLPTIMVTGHGDVAHAVKAMKAGALDFVEKPYAQDVLLIAVSEALKAGAAAEEGDETAAEIRARIEALTPREREVLAGLVAGNPNKIIAHDLKISPRTVEIHRANLMKKMHAKSLSHLVRMTIAARDEAGPGRTPVSTR